MSASTDDSDGIVGVRASLPRRDRNQGSIQTARSDVVAASAAIEQTRLNLDGRLTDAVGRCQTARQCYKQQLSRIDPNTEETYRLSTQSLAAGEYDFLQLLTVMRTVFAPPLWCWMYLGQAKQALSEIEGRLVTLQP